MHGRVKSKRVPVTDQLNVTHSFRPAHFTQPSTPPSSATGTRLARISWCATPSPAPGLEKTAPGRPCHIVSLTAREKVPFGLLESAFGGRMVSCALSGKVFDRLRGAGTPKVRSAPLLARLAAAAVYVQGASPTVAALIRGRDVQLSCGEKSTSITSGYAGRIPPSGTALLLELLASILGVQAQDVPPVKTGSHTLDCLHSALVNPQGSHISAFGKRGRVNYTILIALPSTQDDQHLERG